MSTSYDSEIRRGDEFVESNSRGPVAQVVSRRWFRQMQDGDPMPFGAFRGQAIGKVPAAYLDKLRDADWLEGRHPEVADYIARNAKAIDKELDEAERRSRW